MRFVQDCDCQGVREPARPIGHGRAATGLSMTGPNTTIRTTFLPGSGIKAARRKDRGSTGKEPTNPCKLREQMSRRASRSLRACARAHRWHRPLGASADVCTFIARDARMSSAGQRCVTDLQPPSQLLLLLLFLLLVLLRVLRHAATSTSSTNRTISTTST